MVVEVVVVVVEVWIEVDVVVEDVVEVVEVRGVRCVVVVDSSETGSLSSARNRKYVPEANMTVLASIENTIAINTIVCCNSLALFFRFFPGNPALHSFPIALIHVLF